MDEDSPQQDWFTDGRREMGKEALSLTQAISCINSSSDVE